MAYNTGHDYIHYRLLPNRGKNMQGAESLFYIVKKQGRLIETNAT